MASKVAAAKMAAWSGVRAVIAPSTRPGVLADAVAGTPGVGTVVVLRARGWLLASCGSASPCGPRASSGSTTVRWALTERGVSLLPAGVIGVDGSFEAGDAVDVAGPDGTVFGKGLARLGGRPLGRRRPPHGGAP